MITRIAQLVPEFPSSSETFIVGQIIGLLDRGVDVEILAAYRPWSEPVIHPEVKEFDLMSRTRYIEMPDASAMELSVWPISGVTWMPGEVKPIRNAKRVWAATPTIARAALAAPRLTRDLVDPRHYGDAARSLSAIYRFRALRTLRGRYDVVHAHFGPVANDFRFAPAALGAALIVTFHGYDFSSWPREHGAAAYQDLFRIARAITVNSRYAEQQLIGLGCPAVKVVRLNVGIDVGRFEFAPIKAVDDKVQILTVGRLVPKKGMSDAILALSKARQVNTRLCLEIIGDGPLRTALTDLVSDLGLDEWVTFYGPRDSTFVRTAMKRAHVFVLASRTAPDGDQEGTPVVLMEAMASGLPVISTRHSGIPEIVKDGVSGVLVGEGDVDALAASMVKLASDRTIRERLAQSARAYVERNHDLPAVTDQLISLYASTASTSSDMRPRDVD